MEQAMFSGEERNPDPEISRVTVIVEDVETDVETRTCARRGCLARPDDDSEFCPGHAEDQRRYNAQYMSRKRDEWRAAGKCTRCGGKRTGSRETCLKCRVELGRLDVETDVENHAERVAARLVAARDEHDGFLRKRFKGGKRGAPGIDEQDEFERKIVEQAIERYVVACKWLSSAEGKRSPKEDREQARLAALGQLALAVRAADEILDRNRYVEKRDKAQQRKLVATAREIAKSGR